MTSPASDSTLRRRIASVDLLRGLLMIVMALDHTRDFFSGATVNPTDAAHTWPALFLTRWVTHLCAPGFVALAGTSVYLQRQRGVTAKSMAGKLVTRGLWIVLVEVVFVSFAIFFTYQIHLLQVLYAIGWSMVVLAGLQFLPVRAVAAYGFAVVALHNLLDGVQPPANNTLHAITNLTLAGGVLPLHAQPTWIIPYPFIPWSGIMALGYAFGVVVSKTPAERRRISVRLGAALLTVFAVLRGFHLYGDADKWHTLSTRTRTAMDFFAVTKYPPSLEYWLATTGILLLLFALADSILAAGRAPRAAGVVEVYGRVPFFYYVLHFFLLHIVMAVGWMARNHATHPPPFAFSGPPANWGFGLPVVYAVWIAAVASLYPLCLWFSRLKARRRDWWLSYL